MFTILNALAQQATLMITIAAEGDGQLRVNLTPMPADTKAKSKLPAPLSLLGTPAEFDADFIAALSTWQAPKRTLLQQAQDATGGAVAPATAAPALSAPKAEGKPEKPGRKPRGGKGAEDDKKPDVAPAAAAADETAAGADESSTSTSTDTESGESQALDPAAGDASAPPDSPDVAPAPAPAPAEPATGDEPVDKFTLDLF